MRLLVSDIQLIDVEQIVVDYGGNDELDDIYFFTVITPYDTVYIRFLDSKKCKNEKYYCELLKKVAIEGYLDLEAEEMIEMI